jgi:uncharacterized FlaG/YvyC family protein
VKKTRCLEEKGEGETFKRKAQRRGTTRVIVVPLPRLRETDKTEGETDKQNLRRNKQIQKRVKSLARLIQSYNEEWSQSQESQTGSVCVCVSTCALYNTLLRLFCSRVQNVHKMVPYVVHSVIPIMQH